MGILALPGLTLALWGFGGSNSKSEADIARDEAISVIKAKVASDEFIPPAAGVSRKDARRFALAKSAGEFQCGESVLKWELVNDDYCDCEDGSDEPGTSACGEGEQEVPMHHHVFVHLCRYIGCQASIAVQHSSSSNSRRNIAILLDSSVQYPQWSTSASQSKCPTRDAC